MTDSTRSHHTNRRWVWLALFAGLLLVLLWLGLKTWRVAQAARSLLAQQDAVATLMENGPTEIDANAAETLVMDVRLDVLVIRQETAVFMPLTPYLGWLPRVGPLIVEAPVLLEMADAGTEAAAYAIRGLKPALVTLQDESQAGIDQIAAIVPVIEAATPDLRQAATAFDRFMTARADLGDASELPWTVRNLLQQVDPWLPIARDGLELLPVLPQLMGADGERRYLIVAQNEDEIRPTGGFVTGLGTLTVANGRIVDINFIDANYVDAWDEERRALVKPYGDTPQPLQTFMLLDLFLFRDANFWPDFPVAAGVMLELYSYGQDQPLLDGVIAIDQQFMQMLMQVVGPVTIGEEDVTINGNNVISAMRDAWSIDEGQDRREWLFDRKSFMGTFAGAILARIQADFGSIDPLNFVQTMTDAIAQRHLQIYVRDPIVAAVLDEVGWDGRLQNESGHDLLMVVDTNVGYNKVNHYIDSGIRYQVDLTTKEAEAAITYRHNGSDPGVECYQGTPYVEGVTYLQRADACYWNYLRVYAPAGSTLLEASRHTIPGESLFSGETWNEGAMSITDDPSGLATYANAFLLPWSQNLTAWFRYRLPPDIVQMEGQEQNYRLIVYKQPGLPQQPLEIMVQLPPGSELVSAVPAATSVENQTVRFTTTLETDIVFTITYR